MSSTPNATTPQWLLASDFSMCPCGCIGRRRRRSFLEKSLSDGAHVIRQAVYAEQPVTGQSRPLAAVDPRIKLISALVLLVAVATVHTLAALAAAYLLILGLAVAAGVPLGPFLRRVWLFVPLFTAIAVIPATLSIVTPGDVVLPLWTWQGSPQGVTAQGLTSAGLVVLRAACSVSIVLIVTFSTPWSRLLTALGALGVPRLFVMIVTMAYRYLFVLLTAVSDMFLARKARTIGPVVHDAQARRFVGATAAATIGKANHLAEEVHLAMLARGYRGRMYALDSLRITGADLLALAGAVVLALALYGGDRVLR